MADFDRRDFLKLVGVGAGTAAVSGCSELPEKLIPYVVQPEEITPGIAVTYASTCQECTAGCGLHVRTRESRPVKLEGNPDHPINRGALCARGQAGIGRTYHPDRLRGPMRRGADGSFAPVSWDEAIAEIAAVVREAGPGTFLLSGGTAGPTLSALFDQWLAAVNGGGRLVYEPFAHESLRAASEAVFGVRAQPIFDLEGTDFVIDFGADSLETWVSPTEHARQLADARDVTNEGRRVARLVYVGPRLSLTAANADEWLPAKPGTEGILALAIARAVLDEAGEGAEEGEGEAVAGHRSLLSGFDAQTIAPRAGVSAGDIRRIATALVAAERPAALPPGVGLTGRRATATTAAVLILNAVAGAVGKTVRVPAEPETGASASFREVTGFIDAAKAGNVRVLVIHGTNPVHSLPPESGFAEALEKVELVVSTASIPDETSQRAHFVLPDHSPMESWGDAAPRAGVRSLVQPTLRPLFDTRAVGDTLLALGRAVSEQAAAVLPEGSFHSVLESAWADTDWRAALARGGVFTDASPGEVAAGAVSGLAFEEPELDGDGPYTLIAHPSPLLGDGSGAHLPWLQETPDPVTKIAWQSWAEVSRNTADSLGVRLGEVLAVETPAGSIEVPVFPRGGIRDDVVAIAIGQGHTVGRYASRSKDAGPGAARGVNVISVLPAATDESGGRAWLTTTATLRKTGRFERVALTQSSDNQRGRAIGDTISLAALAASGEEGESHGGGHGGGHEILRPFDAAADATEESSYRWGMTIDLDRCSGCSACIVACSIENNIPQIGEEGVLRSRQMSWLRIERFVGEGSPQLDAARPKYADHEELGDVDIRHFLALCQQCGAAPCEPVCPVFATYHSPEGLNGMIYNRCIGTRYCSNNCPYKVRRFNYYDYQLEAWPEPMRLMLNPDVTVRGQGVMEKCTFCVQRIQEARQPAKDEGRPIRDGEVTTACQQTCPTQAITFGNLRDDKSATREKAHVSDARSYHALHVLNTRPGITYLKKVTRGLERGKA